MEGKNEWKGKMNARRQGKMNGGKNEWRGNECKGKMNGGEMNARRQGKMNGRKRYKVPG